MKNIKGNALSQYGIIIALIALVLVPLFLTFGQTIVGHFTHFFNLLSDKQTTKISISKPGTGNKVNNTLIPVSDEDILNGSVKAGQMGGTTNTPVSKCVDNVCTIDYGEFILNGIPENFNEFVESSGTSGGTDKLFTLLNQIADQLEEKGDLDGSKHYRDMANLGHFMADIQEQVEAKAKECSGQTFSSASSGCGPSVSGDNTDSFDTDLSSLELPENVTVLLPDFYTPPPLARSTEFYQSTSSLTDYQTLGFARNFQIENKQAFEEFSNRYPSAAIIKIFDEVNNSPNYSDGMKQVTRELLNYIDGLAFTQEAFIELQNTGISRTITATNKNKYDIMTGEIIEGVNISNLNGTIMNPEVSFDTDLNSALVCSTGSNIDTNNSCNNK